MDPTSSYGGSALAPPAWSPATHGHSIRISSPDLIVTESGLCGKSSLPSTGLRTSIAGRLRGKPIHAHPGWPLRLSSVRLSQAHRLGKTPALNSGEGCPSWLQISRVQGEDDPIPRGGNPRSLASVRGAGELLDRGSLVRVELEGAVEMGNLEDFLQLRAERRDDSLATVRLQAGPRLQQQGQSP